MSLCETDGVSEQLTEYISNGGCLVDISPSSSQLTVSHVLLQTRSSREASLVESDSETVSSLLAATMELTDDMLTAISRWDSDSEYFDALDESIRLTLSPVAMRTDKVKVLTVKEKDILTSSTLMNNVTLSLKVYSLFLSNKQEFVCCLINRVIGLLLTTF